MTMTAMNHKLKNTKLEKSAKILVVGFILLSAILVPLPSCTDIEGDGADTLYWEGVTLPEESSYRNPIWEPDLSNPSVFRGATQFFAFGDEKEWSAGLNYVVPVLRSSNLMSWSLSGEAFAERPVWAEGTIASVSGIFSKTLGTYYLAYTIGDAGIGIAYSKAPQGPYIDYGKIIDPASPGFAACKEPFFIQAGLKFYIFFETPDGIYGVEMSVIRNNAPSVKGLPFRIAGPEFSGIYIYRKSSTSYYFFGNSETDGNTGIKIAQASDISGPYLDKEGNDILNGNGTQLVTGSASGGFFSPSHVGGIFTDFENKEWIIYQVTDPSKPLLSSGSERHPLMLNKIEWDELGWPVTPIQSAQGWQKPKYSLTN